MVYKCILYIYRPLRRGNLMVSPTVSQAEGPGFESESSEFLGIIVQNSILIYWDEKICKQK